MRVFVYKLNLRNKKLLPFYLSPLAPRYGTWRCPYSGIGLVCVFGILCRSNLWYRLVSCGSASSPTVIEGQPTDFGLLYYVHVVRIHIPAPLISSSVRPVIFLMRESSNPSACKFLAVSNFPFCIPF